MNAEDAELRDAMRSVHGTWRVWLVVLLVVALGGAGIYHLREELERAKEQAADSDARATQRLAELQTLAQARAELDQRIEEREKTLAELMPLQQKLDEDAKTKRAIVTKLEALSASIREALKAELASKDNGELTIADERLKLALRDRVFFDAPESLLSKKGEATLSKLGTVLSAPENAESLRELRIFAHFEEPSALHATAIARYLGEKHNLAEKITASSTFGATRARNRRIGIEIEINPPSPPAAPAQ